ncbi:MAG: cellulase family glycosylhydrolase [Oscillospiraceae bacterium]|nr:cellulase family glycosylhydrolase [Oscillospiraceae bacterium]
MKAKKLLSFLMALAVMMTSFVGVSSSVSATGTTTSGTSENMSTMDFVLSMGIGINLGNTMEATNSNGTTVRSFETAWGSPVITKDIIQGYADAGFGVIRIPVAWSNMMDDNYNIDEAYIERVQQIVDWVLECGMKAIVNIHWDGGWWDGFSTDKNECMKKYKSIWTQISEAFKDYSLDLMFESMNEEGCWDDIWNRYGSSTSGKKKAYELLGEINQTFVDVVRESGGNNELRHLLIAGYATDPDLTCDEMFVLPDDPANRYAISIHYYAPSTFTVISEDASWGKAQSTWGTTSDYKYLNKIMDMIYDTYVANGIPVIIGEYGCTTSNKTDETVREYLTAVCEAAYTRGMCPILWDTPGGFYNRKTCEFTDSELLEEFMEIAAMNRAVEMSTYDDVEETEDTIELTATASDGEVKLSWTSTLSDVEYTIYYKHSTSDTWKAAGTTAKLKVTITGLKNGTSYDFKVVAEDTESDTVTATPKA